MSELKYIPFEEEAEDIKIKVTNYWTERADSFLVQRQRELGSSKAAQWMQEITAWLPDPKSMDKPVRILDVGCGTGYFVVLLGKEGFEVTSGEFLEDGIPHVEMRRAL